MRERVNTNFGSYFLFWSLAIQIVALKFNEYSYMMQKWSPLYTYNHSPIHILQYQITFTVGSKSNCQWFRTSATIASMYWGLGWHHYDLYWSPEFEVMTAKVTYQIYIFLVSSYLCKYLNNQIHLGLSPVFL